MNTKLRKFLLKIISDRIQSDNLLGGSFAHDYCEQIGETLTEFEQDPAMKEWINHIEALVL